MSEPKETSITVCPVDRCWYAETSRSSMRITSNWIHAGGPWRYAGAGLQQSSLFAMGRIS